MKCLKLLFVTVLSCAFIAALAILTPKLCFADGEGYTFFCGEQSKNCKEVNVQGNAALVKLTLDDVCGECVFYSDLDLDAYLKKVNGKVVFKEELSDSVNYYCTADLPYSVMLYGKEINLHVCVKDGGVKVASPIIFGGF